MGFVSRKKEKRRNKNIFLSLKPDFWSTKCQGQYQYLIYVLHGSMTSLAVFMIYRVPGWMIPLEAFDLVFRMHENLHNRGHHATIGVISHEYDGAILVPDITWWWNYRSNVESVSAYSDLKWMLLATWLFRCNEQLITHYWGRRLCSYVADGILGCEVFLLVTCGMKWF